MGQRHQMSYIGGAQKGVKGFSLPFKNTGSKQVLTHSSAERVSGYKCWIVVNDSWFLQKTSLGRRKKITLEQEECRQVGDQGHDLMVQGLGQQCSFCYFCPQLHLLFVCVCGAVLWASLPQPFFLESNVSQLPRSVALAWLQQGRGEQHLELFKGDALARASLLKL